MYLIKDFRFILFTLLINFLIALFLYQSIFRLEFQGDTWQYAWGHKIYYGNNVFSAESLKGMRTSLGGASLTFGLIENNLGLNASVFYSLSFILKFLTVVVLFLLVLKLTRNKLASLVASMLLTVSFAGVEATHWVFNMYAYIGLIFITLSILIGWDLPENFKFKRWSIAFIFACLGVWYATMRTNGIIPLIIIWSFYKFITLRSKSSKKNLIFWVVGFVIFILIDKFLLGQMETDYSRYYIIGEGIRAFQIQTANLKYDFLFSPASNFGTVLLPDTTWYALNFPKIFSFFGQGIFRNIIFPSFIIFSIISWVLTRAIKNSVGKLSPRFLLLFSLGLIWTIVLYLTSLIGPKNFSSWGSLVVTLFGGYFMIFCLFLIVIKEIPMHLKDLFLLALIWSFVFLLVPLFMNGGPMLGTYHRYLVTTAPAVAILMGGLITVGSIYKSNLLRVLLFMLVVIMIFSHASNTKSFFDRKAMVHNKAISARIWEQFTRIVPNKDEYPKNPPKTDENDKIPTIWFEYADNLLDRETLFESLYFGFLFQASIKYNWNPHAGHGLYYNNYSDLIRDVKKNPKILNEFYAIRMENQSLIDITKIMKQKIAEDIEKIP